MKCSLAIALLIVCLAVSLQASTLTVNQGIAGGVLFAPARVNVGGSDFSISGIDVVHFVCCVGNVITFSMFDFNFGGVHYRNSNGFNDSIMRFTLDGTIGPLDISHYQGPYSVPFTMDGHISVAGGFDLDGIGVLIAGRDSDNKIYYHYSFDDPPAVSEPIAASVILPGIAILVLLKRRSVRSEKGREL
jgi:hypothetical protein